MTYSKGHKGREDEIVNVFKSTFTASEGAEEGALIGTLVRDQMITTPETNLHVFVALEEGKVIGGAVLTPLEFTQDPRRVFLLSPVAVLQHWQGQGVGQGLLQFALNSLREDGADAAITYGDPNYYARVGFRQITQADAASPYPLQHPEGWLGQSLSDQPFTPLQGASMCVPALRVPALW